MGTASGDHGRARDDGTRVPVHGVDPVVMARGETVMRMVTDAYPGEGDGELGGRSTAS
jgi:hypothetical protein